MRGRRPPGQAGSGRRRGLQRRMSVAVVCAAALVVPLAGPAGAAPGEQPEFGSNVFVFDPSMPTSEIQATFDEIWELQRDAEMGSGRYSLLFMPGEYGSVNEPLLGRVGYYTEVAGLAIRFLGL